MKLIMWQAGTSHSGCSRSMIFDKGFPCGMPGPGRYPHRGLRLGKRRIQFMKNGASVSLTSDQRGTCGVSETLFDTTLDTPSISPAKRLIMNVIDPTQWQ